ncbi:type I polyketide synthase [Cognatishimia activa]|uniref:Beta-ketoacyl-acyl-carrier-protein synthase I n=1 Tax=Cognatishimia activa TaxID=1715691 RepID=A0A0P1IMV0_9RHOB|nr:type I polyketide synthase [Cognatishimia activa]CUJ13051.1 Beta-ketoacyl-acyl-carrier-protein synthase I [Cognatishimia activa]CUK24949.1 Beta-ketoacyl-acyl-carrier-protein synthase I [Cognatishimia activa]
MAEKPASAFWTENDIAIVGMAAHLPGSATLDQYWANLRDGVECITPLSEEELLDAGESSVRLKHKNYVKSAAILKDFEKFDAEFFGLSPKEAAIMDPQHRQFLEVSWEALENANHVPENFAGDIGVFGGCGMGSYFYFNLCSNRDLVDSTGMFLLRHTGNDKDFLSTRLSHILDLKGPSMSVQTACSTSLVATHYACQSLLNGECDMALAGGVTIELPHKRGYIFEEGEILSPDGHCHAFDHRAQGTVFGSGAGVVVLRRMQDALADGDHIWAVIRGSAVNNDGSDKAGYLAPSVDGQAAAIMDALEISDVPADTVDYVECHGTGTYLGDPIEIAALTEAFRETTDEAGFCRVGSVKTNIGHLDTAAGAASLIKASMALKNAQMPPSLGFEKPNPTIDFETSPFRVNNQLQDWTSHKGPRRAGVNSLGVGGTNAHVVLEEAQPLPASEESDWPFQLLTISGRTNKALDANAAALAAHLRAHPEQNLADVAYTLQKGRRAFEKRRVVVASSHEEAADLLEAKDQRRVFSHTAEVQDPDVVFMFPGGGAQHVNMARDLYETEPVFQEWMDQGLAILGQKSEIDARALWLADGIDEAAAHRELLRPSVQLPLIMITEYALAQLLKSWGVEPAALVGHSMGENTAACLAGVMSFEDCIGLVLLRGQLFETVPAGGMLSVPLSRGALEPMLGDDLDIAGENATDLTVVSGPDAALDALAAKLSEQEIEAQRIAINIAAHSRMLEPILERFGDYLRLITLNAPSLPIISNRTGEPLTDQQAMDPDYWVQHLRGTVRFADCIGALAEVPGRIFLEVGPGKALSSLAGMHPSVGQGKAISSLRHPDQEIEDDLYFMSVLGRLWANGAEFDWSQIWGDARRNRVILPSYQFQRTSYFIEPDTRHIPEAEELLRTEDRTQWGYRPVWTPKFAEYDVDALADLSLTEPQSWLIFVDEDGLGRDLSRTLREAGHSVVEVAPGDAFGKLTDTQYVISPERGREGYDQLLKDLIANGQAPNRILHMWLLTSKESFRPGSSFFHRNLEQGFHSLMFLGQAVIDENLPQPVHMTCVTNGAASVGQDPLTYPEKATIRGPLGVIPREVPGMTCASIDVELGAALAGHLLEDLIAPPRSFQAAYRDGKRFELSQKSNAFAPEKVIAWEKGKTYLITGGFGGIGVTVARDMLSAGANVALLSRSELPDRSEWLKITAFSGRSDKLAKKIAIVQELEQLKGRLEIVTGDVCNLVEMQAAVQHVRDTFGGLHGVIHAAGAIDDGPLLAKTSAQVEEVLAPKTHGTMIVDQIFADGELDFLALFSSTSTVLAPVGQVDYVAANAFLNAYADSRKGDQTKVTAVNWGIWSDVGMAVDNVSDRTAPAGPAEPRDIDAAALQQVVIEDDGTIVFSMALSSATSWMLDQHRTKAGEAIFPGTGYLELIAEAMQTLDETAAYEVRELTFLRALHVDDGATKTVQLKLRPDEVGYRFELLSDYKDAFVRHAEGHVSMVALPAPQAFDLEEIKSRMPEPVLAEKDAHITSQQEAHLNFGPHWNVLKSVALGQGEGVAELSLSEGLIAEAQSVPLHPGLLDLGTGWAMELIEGYEAKNLWVPVNYSALRHYGQLPSQIVSWVKAVRGSSEEGSASFDVVLADTDGNVCVEVDGLSIRRLDSAFTVQSLPRPSEAELVRSVDPQAPVLSAAEQRLQHNLSQGIPSKDGALALRRALGTGLSNVIVSSLELDGLKRQIAQQSIAQDTDTQGFERPDLDNDFVAPRNDVERTLTGFWQDLLGIEELGVQDNFFDLGGHSLIAVRLFAMVKKAYRIEFPISILFEAPTIEKCAELIIERIGDQTADSGDQPAQSEAIAPESRYTHIVPMHQAGNSQKAPFFLVAGMYGNVLNLRHLAHLIGADRPFYGLQARGLFGDVAPHDDIEEAARDYLIELRSVQPHGPYMLGGFSGGGLTAYEMARQLKAVGEEVSLVVMLDTPLPVRRALTFQDRIKIQWLDLKKGGAGYIFKWAKNRILWEFTKRRKAEATEDDGAQFHNAEIEAAFYRALPKYDVQLWEGRVALYRPPLVGKWQVAKDRWVNSERTYVLHDNDWGQFASDLHVTEVPGDHDSMVLEPNVRVLAAHIRKEIQKAERGNAVILPFRRAAE